MRDLILSRNKFSFLTLMGLVGLITCTDVNITVFRNSTTFFSNFLINSYDIFNISSSYCGNNDDHCKPFDGVKMEGNCYCMCSEDRSILGYYNGKWKCTKNSVVRQHSGCTYYLQNVDNNVQNSPLYTLPVLSTTKDSNYVNGIPVNKTCKFVRNNSTFLKCDGSWGHLDDSILDDKTLTLQDTIQGSLYVGPYKPSQHKYLSGRLMRIPIECSGLTWTSSQCVAMKLKGNLNCMYSSGFSINDVAPPASPTEQTATTTVTTQSSNAPRKEEPTQANLTTIIASSVAGGAGFVIIIIFIIFLVLCIRRRKAKKEKNTRVSRGQDNQAYEQSMTISNPNARPLPEVPAWPYSSIQRGPSPTIRTPNGTIAAQLESSNPNTLTRNNEPLYGSIDDGNYSRLDHTKQTLPIDPPHRNSYHYLPSPKHSQTTPNKSGTQISTGSDFSGFIPYDVVGGRIDGTLIRRDSTFLEPDEGRTSTGSGVGYDVPEGILKDTLDRSGKRFGDSRELSEPSMFQSLDRKTLPGRRDLENNRAESYEAVWEPGNDEDFVTKIELD